MNEPKVSVVIPAYNQAEYLDQAIQSALNQTYNNYEIIVVDDGSTDNSREVVGHFGNRVRYVWQKNLGLSAARNAGIRIARGEYIALLDSDDLFEPDFLSTLIMTLERNPRADAIYCVAQTVDLANNPLPQRIGRVVLPELFYETLLKGGFFPPTCMLAHKYCYDNYLFDESLRRVEDLDLWLKIARHYTVIGLDKVLVRYRITPNSLSNDPSLVLSHRLSILQTHFGNEPQAYMHWKPKQSEAFGRSYFAAACEYIQLHNLREAYRFILKAFNTCPELAADLEIFYNLGLGDQPRGYRGTFLGINLQRNARLLRGMLVRLFDDPSATKQLKSQCRTAFSNAYLALGLISYGTKNYLQARYFLALAVITVPSNLFNKLLITTFVKSLLPVKVIEWLKVMKFKINPQRSW